MARRRTRSKAARRRPLGRWLAMGGILLLVLFVIGGFALYLALRAYLHSDRFRGMLAGQVGSTFDAEAEFADFKWTGTTAYTDSFKAQGFPEAHFAKVKANGIKTRVNFSAVRRGVWEIADLDIERVNLLLTHEERLAPHPVYDESIPDPAGSTKRGLFSGFIPDRVELVRAGVAEFNFDALLGDSTVTGRSMALELEPTSNEEVYRIHARRGMVRIPDQPSLELEEAELRAGAGGAIIDRADFLFHETARLGLSGRVNMPEGGGTRLNLDVLLREVPADRVLPEDWIKRLKGTIEADAQITGSPGAGAEASTLKLEGEGRLLGGVLEAMPVLERIDDMLGSSKFRRLSFNEFKVNFERSDGGISLTDYFALSSGSACLKGHAELPPKGASSGPSGRYMLGITQDTIKWLPLIKKQIIEGVFKYDRDAAFGIVFGHKTEDIDKPPEGFRWAVAQIDASALDPYTADLRSQFFGVGGMAIWAELVGVSEQGVKALELIASSAREQGVDAIALLSKNAGDDGLFSSANLLRVSRELGVVSAMQKILGGAIDAATGLPGTIIDVGTGLLNNLPFP